MTTNSRWHFWLGLLVLASILPAGCANTGGGSQEYDYGISSSDTVPPAYYGDSPQLEQWYTPPYWQPDAD
jgi:hypothetical protein